MKNFRINSCFLHFYFEQFKFLNQLEDFKIRLSRLVFQKTETINLGFTILIVLK